MRRKALEAEGSKAAGRTTESLHDHPATNLKLREHSKPCVPSGHAPAILRLPKELLIRIMSYVIGSRLFNEICLYSHEYEDEEAMFERPATNPYLNMLLTCRDFYSSGIETYYAEYILSFDSVAHLRAVLNGLGKDRKACIKRIVVNLKFEFKRWPRKKGSVPLFVPDEKLDLPEDALTELPKLQCAEVWILCNKLPKEHTERARDEMERLIRRAWSSKADKIVMKCLGDDSRYG